MVFSPNVVTVTEGLITFALFPLLVQLAYWADKGYFSFKTDGCCRSLCCRRRRAAPVELKEGTHIIGISAEDGEIRTNKEVNELLAASADPRCAPGPAA